MGGVQSSAQNLGDALWMHERQRQRDQSRDGVVGRYEPQEVENCDTQDRRKLLKRTRSLAVITEDTLRSDRESRHLQLDENEFDLPRRPQLIPRAKLIDRNSLKDRLSKSQQHLSEPYDRSNDSRSYHSRSTCELYSVPPGLSSFPDPPLYGRISRADPDRLNILDWPRTPRRYRSHQDLDTVSGLVDIVEDDWPIDDYRSIDCIYTQAKRKRKEHRSLDSILFEDDDELEYFDVLNLLPLSKVRLEFDDTDARPGSNNFDNRSRNNDTRSSCRFDREFNPKTNKNNDDPTTSETDEDQSIVDSELTDRRRSSGPEITEIIDEETKKFGNNFTDEEKCQNQPRPDYPEIVEFHQRRDSRESCESLTSFTLKKSVDREIDANQDSRNFFFNPTGSEIGKLDNAIASTLNLEAEIDRASGKYRDDDRVDNCEPILVTTLKEIATRNRKVEEAEDYKSIWISDSEEPEEMSRRPQIIKVVDNEVTKKRERCSNVVDRNAVARESDARDQRDFVTDVVTEKSNARKDQCPDVDIDGPVEERGSNGAPIDEKPDVETARTFFENKTSKDETSRNRRNEGRFERIVKETSNILEKACNVVRGSLGFEARSESSDLGLGSDCGSDERRRSIDDGVDVVDDAISSPNVPEKSVEIRSKHDDNATVETGRKSRKNLTRSRSCVDSIDCPDDEGPDFDHVRYKIVKSRLFGKNIFNNAIDKRDVNYDGLMEYLSEYSFQELLLDNNVVIIEPVRAENVERKPSSVGSKTRSHGDWKISTSADGRAIETKNSVMNMEKINQPTSKVTKQSSLRKHFFYHPIRVNRELIDEELPDPDTVRNVRRMFENTLRSKNVGKKMIDNDGKSRNCVSMKDLSSIDERRLDDVNERGFEKSSRSRCSSRAKDLTRLFEGLDKTVPNQSTKSDGDSPKSETKTRILAQSFEARSGNTSPSDAITTTNKPSRYRHQNHHQTHHRRQRQINWDAGSVSSGVSSDYPDTDPGSGAQCTSSEDEDADAINDYESQETDRVSGHFVSQDVLKKIRECGTSVTYYGGKVVNTCNGPLISPMSCKLAKRNERALMGNEDYVKFRLVKSNSCDSRLELAGRVVERRSRLEAREFASKTSSDKMTNLRDSTIAETPSIEITTMDNRVVDLDKDMENNENNETKREPPIVIGLEPKKDETKNVDGFKADFKLGKITDSRSGYVNRFGSALTRWQVNETNWKKTSPDFGKMEFEEFEVLEDSLNGN